MRSRRRGRWGRGGGGRRGSLGERCLGQVVAALRSTQPVCRGTMRIAARGDGMGVQGPTVQTVSIAEGERQFSSLVDRVADGVTRVLVEQSGVTVAALVSADD